MVQSLIAFDFYITHDVWPYFDSSNNTQEPHTGCYSGSSSRDVEGGSRIHILDYRIRVWYDAYIDILMTIVTMLHRWVSPAIGSVPCRL